jgi:hypothetical protein
MAINESRLRVTELDFDNIKDNLKFFLKGQDKFKDYDFEGSGMNILLDTLAYNTHYMAFNANMVANEMFLDSASLRSSAVSHAKMLGYEVTSARAPKATINVNLQTTDATKTMSAGTAFTTTIDGTNYQFVTTSDVTKANSGNSVNFDSIDIYEGTYITTKFIVDTSNPDQKFILTDPRADTSTLTVKIQTSTTDTSTLTYTKADDITQLSATSTVYYLQEVERGRFEVYFGDGVVSKALEDGNIVQLQYVVTNKGVANGVSTFSPPSTIDGVSDIVVTTVSGAIGGSEAESINSIKLKAPLNYSAQGRAVTTSDYEVYVKKLFANTQAVSVWGGEDGSYDSSTGVSSTPEYGKVFISIKSTTGVDLTSTQKDNLVKSLSPYKVASVTPVIVDAETTELILGVTFNFDSSSTTSTGTELASLVNTTLQNYDASDLQTFNRPFRHSKVLRLIDETDTAILNNTTTVTMAKKFSPTLSTATSYNINFNNRFYNPVSGYNATGGGIVSSTGFYMNSVTTIEYFFDDDGSGNLRIYYLVGNTRTYTNSTAGTVDYPTGLIKINSMIITGVANVDGATSSQIRITALPNSNDIVPVRNQILDIDFSNTTITSSVDATATTGKGYTTSTTSAGTTTTTVSTTTSTPSSSAY